MIKTLPFHDNIIIFEVICTTTPYFGKGSCMSISSKLSTFHIILFNLSNKYYACIFWFDAIRWSTVVYVTYETVFFHSFDIMYYISFYLGSDRYNILKFLQRSQMPRQFSLIYDKFLTEKCPCSGMSHLCDSKLGYNVSIFMSFNIFNFLLQYYIFSIICNFVLDGFYLLFWLFAWKF